MSRIPIHDNFSQQHPSLPNQNHFADISTMIRFSTDVHQAQYQVMPAQTQPPQAQAPPLRTEPQSSALSHRCHLCPMAFTKESGLKRHMRVHRTKPEPAVQAPQTFPCAVCHIPFNNGADLKYHMETHHFGFATQVQKCAGCGCFRQMTLHCVTNPFRCETCSFQMQKHPQNAHSNGTQNYQVLSNVPYSGTAGNQQLSKPIPNKIMAVKRNASSSGSSPINRPPKAHQCPDCPKSFAHANTLTLHRKTHTGEYKDICEYCDKTFVLHDYYIRHLRVHTKEKPYQCDVCDKSFSQSNTLTQHKRTHTGEKPYACEECGKSFSVRDYLNKHRRVHTGEKPYDCEVCGKKYSQPSALSSHKKQHSHFGPGSPDSTDFPPIKN